MSENPQAKIKEPVQMVINKTDLEVLQEVGSGLGISISVLKDEGETYIAGQKDKVKAGGAYIAIAGGSGKNNDLSDFWTKVNEKRASK